MTRGCFLCFSLEAYFFLYHPSSEGMLISLKSKEIKFIQYKFVYNVFSSRVTTYTYRVCLMHMIG